MTDAEKQMRAHKKRDGWLIVDGSGRCRYLTFGERLRWILFGTLPGKV